VMTGGLSTLAREATAGSWATRHHQGFMWNQGMIAGMGGVIIFNSFAYSYLMRFTWGGYVWFASQIPYTIPAALKIAGVLFWGEELHWSNIFDVLEILEFAVAFKGLPPITQSQRNSINQALRDLSKISGEVKGTGGSGVIGGGRGGGFPPAGGLVPISPDGYIPPRAVPTPRPPGTSSGGQRNLPPIVPINPNPLGKPSAGNAPNASPDIPSSIPSPNSNVSDGIQGNSGISGNNKSTSIRKRDYPSRVRKGTKEVLEKQATGSDGLIRCQNPNCDISGGRTLQPGKGTIEHDPPLVETHNTKGYNTDQKTRNDLYNNTATAIHCPECQAQQGGQITQRYRNDTGPNYQPRGQK
jgi:hypothetical protein